MGRRLVPATILAATWRSRSPPSPPAWFPTAAGRGTRPSLAVVGGITPMIYAVNIRIVPVFSQRNWRSGTLLRRESS